MRKRVSDSLPTLVAIVDAQHYRVSLHSAHEHKAETKRASNTSMIREVRFRSNGETERSAEVIEMTCRELEREVRELGLGYIAAGCFISVVA